jgi:ComF family protein
MLGALTPLLEILAPDRCAGCDGPVDIPGTGWCGDCLGSLPWLDDDRCAGCGSIREPLGGCRSCAAAGRPWTDLVSAVAYEEPIQALIQRWKYPGDPALSRAMEHLLRGISAHRIEGTRVVPVPQAEASWRGRGFSPSVDLARQVARQHRAPVVHAIGRSAQGTTQVGLTARQRRRNVARLFRPVPRRARSLAGHPVLLVDDVVTTTATATACTQILLQAGAASVRVVALARARGRGEPCTRAT